MVSVGADVVGANGVGSEGVGFVRAAFLVLRESLQRWRNTIAVFFDFFLLSFPNRYF